MKRMFKVAAILAVLLVAFSSLALADTKHADINYGKKSDGDGDWGFVWTKELDDENDWGVIQPYMRIFIKRTLNNSNRFKKQVDGAYVEDGQQLVTIIGSRLGVNYSDYVAKFDGSNRQFGIRVYPYNLDLGVINLNFDATALLGSHKEPNGKTVEDKVYEWKKDDKTIPTIKPEHIGLLFGVSGNIFDAEVKAALVRYYNDAKEANFYNYSAQAEMEVVPGLVVSGLYAGYSENEDFLYEVKADYDILPDFVSIRAGHRNSEIAGDGDEPWKNNPAILGGLGGSSTDGKYRYVAKEDPIKDLYNRGNSINVGATVWYDFDIVENELKVDFDTTNPKKRSDLDSKLAVDLDTKVLNFGIKNSFYTLIADEEETDKDNRLGYGLKFTAKYDLPVPVVNSLTATGKVNFDWDNNYVEDNRTHTIVGLELASSVDILKAKNVGFGAIAFYDMPSDEELIEDAFKYALLAKYDAPNGVRFRLEYNSSVDFGTETKHVHDDKLNDRYDSFRHYDNSKFDGVRFAVGFPL